MKQTITIASAEVKTSKTGKKYMEVKDYENNKYSCWEDILWMELEQAQGKEIELEITQSGNYKNIVGAGTMMPTDNYFPAKNTRSKQIAQAMDRKQDFIKESQGSKELGIKISSTARDSVLIATTILQGKNPNEIQMKNEIVKWREWLLQQWDIR